MALGRHLVLGTWTLKVRRHRYTHQSIVLTAKCASATTVEHVTPSADSLELYILVRTYVYTQRVQGQIYLMHKHKPQGSQPACMKTFEAQGKHIWVLRSCGIRMMHNEVSGCQRHLRHGFWN